MRDSFYAAGTIIRMVVAPVLSDVMATEILSLFNDGA